MKYLMPLVFAAQVCIALPAAAVSITVAGTGKDLDKSFDFSANYDTSSSPVYGSGNYYQFDITSFNFEQNGSSFQVLSPRIAYASSSSNRSVSIFGQSNLPNRDYVTVFLSYKPQDAISVMTLPGISQISGFTSAQYIISGRVNSLTSVSITEAVGAVPEPTTWAMMILGMGMVGIAMRRRKRKGHGSGQLSGVTYQVRTA
jgi:hypothetical protein